MPKIFPKENQENLAICVTGLGATKDFSALVSDTLLDINCLTPSQCFPLYTYTQQSDLGDLFRYRDPGNATAKQDEYLRNENIHNAILTDFQTTYSDTDITKEDIFYYVYGILHSPEYKTRFAADLKKMLPRIPYAADFWTFSKAGRDLAHWHLNYETIEPYPVKEYTDFSGTVDYRVSKMTFGKHNRQVDKTTIIYNSKIQIQNIPLEAYEYKVCDRSALEWIMDRYQVTKDKKSGITNDPNDWSSDPRYILDLVKRIVRVSLETQQIVHSLPPLHN